MQIISIIQTRHNCFYCFFSIWRFIVVISRDQCLTDQMWPGWLATVKFQNSNFPVSGNQHLPRETLLLQLILNRYSVIPIQCSVMADWLSLDRIALCGGVPEEV